MAVYLVKRLYTPTFCNLPVMRDLHCTDLVTESVKQMERGVEPTLFAKVKSSNLDIKTLLVRKLIVFTVLQSPK